MTILNKAGCLLMASALLVACIEAGAQSLPEPDPLTQVIALVDQDHPDFLHTAEELVAAIGGKRDQEGARIASAFSYPASATLLIPQRIPDERRARMEIEDPEERLQRFIVLTYASVDEARHAVTTLERTAPVVGVELNVPLRLSASVTDPRFSYGSGMDPWDYQWGHSDAYLQLNSAWDKSHGTAYVAVIDTGIQQTHPDLDKNFRKLLSFHHAYADSGVEEGRGYESYGWRGHGTHVAGIIGANTTLGSPPAGFRNPTSRLGAGVCLDCSLMIINSASITSWPNPYLYVTLTPAHLAISMNFAITAGAQVINMSFSSQDPTHHCNGGTSTTGAMCTAILFAAQRDVIMVAATGNDNIGIPGFPASQKEVIPVGGMDASGARWDDAPDSIYGSNWGGWMYTRGFIAPARDVLSTVYTGYDWNEYRCGDQVIAANFNSALSYPNDPGFGVCTGTSMAAPFVTGIVALVRTANPLKSTLDVRTYMTSTGSDASFPSAERGNGHPRANAALTAAQSGHNRLTPLFGLARSTVATTAPILFTVVPQMAVAGMNDTLRPRGNQKNLSPYYPRGSTINEYPAFPGGPAGYPPRASVWVFATHVNPKNASAPLQPLRRYTRCGSTACTTTHSNHGAHAYATALADETTLLAQNFRYIGIEGYVYPLSATKPTGTVRLMRAYSNTATSYTLFPEGSHPGGDYDAGVALGYVYVNSGPRPTII